jgi:hypothetical protein
VEIVATIFPGNVHTALKRHAALRLLLILIQLVQTNQTNRVSNNSKPKIEGLSHSMGESDSFSAQHVFSR